MLMPDLGGRVLVLADEARAARLREEVPGAEVLTDAAALGRVQGEYDAVLIDGWLERDPWDRWLLRRVHRLLRNDAPVVVAVPPLLSLASAIDLEFLGYALRKVLHRMLKRWQPDRRLPPGTRRRYYLERLARTLESIGFTGVTGRSSPATWLARRVTITARKAAIRPGPQRIHARREQAVEIPAAREAWLRRFPAYRRVAARPLVPETLAKARVLVLAPHPDDELIGCGGTLCALVDAGARATIVHATDGSRLESLQELPDERRRNVRLEEARRVAAALGAEVRAWKEEDGRLRCDAASVARLREVLGELRPTHVFTPFLGDIHADHRALSRILGKALPGTGVEPEVLQYEVWALVPANAYCDMTAHAPRLEALLLLYESAMQVDDFIVFCERRNLDRGRELTGRAAQVEAFLSTPGAEFSRLAGAGE